MNSGRAGTGSSSVGRPDHVLLCTHGHSELADDNSTTAYTFTEATKSIKVTVSVADLPSLSYFHVSCPDLQDSPFAESPEILWSSEDLVLFRVDLAGSDPRRREFFIYRAGREPSLDLLPDVGAYFFREGLNPALAGVIPDGDGDGRGFVLAVFKRDWRSGQCKLHVFRSKRRAWTIEHLAPDLRSWITKRSPVSPKKVVAVGGAVGYVDHWKGILLCKVLEEPVTTHFIPLPNPLPGNRRHYGGGSSGRLIRDVACSDDGSTITCVEMEDLHRVIRSGAPGPDADVLQDSDVDPTKVVETVKLRWVGWRLVTWHREVSSDRWRKGCILHDGELGTLSLPPHPARTQPLPPEHLKPSGSASGPDKLPLNRMFTCCPILCRDGVVCLLSRRGNYSDKDAWIVTVDMRKKEVIGVAPFYDERVMLFNPAYISCALKKYLKSESDGGGSLAVEVEDTCTHGKASSAVPEKHK